MSRISEKDELPSNRPPIRYAFSIMPAQPRDPVRTASISANPGTGQFLLNKTESRRHWSIYVDRSRHIEKTLVPLDIAAGQPPCRTQKLANDGTTGHTSQDLSERAGELKLLDSLRKQSKYERTPKQSQLVPNAPAGPPLTAQFPENPARASEMRYTGPYNHHSRPRPSRNSKLCIP